MSGLLVFWVYICYFTTPSFPVEKHYKGIVFCSLFVHRMLRTPLFPVEMLWAGWRECGGGCVFCFTFRGVNVWGGGCDVF